MEIAIWIVVGLTYASGVAVAHRTIKRRWGQFIDNSPAESTEMVYLFCWFSWLADQWIKRLLDPVWLQTHQSVERV